MADKAGRLFPEDCSPQVLAGARPYVSRGGLKLERALKAFRVLPEGKTAVDVGASTGGFTDCLLQQGAAKVYAIDVGYGQLDWKLQNDARVVRLDRQNIRHLEPSQIGAPVDLAVIDVSFISLKIVLPPVMKLLKPEGDLIALVKPQFEVGKGEVEKKGIIKDQRKHLNVLLALDDFIRERNWTLRDIVPSPITGQKGNKEFLIHCASGGRHERVGEERIRDAVLG